MKSLVARRLARLGFLVVLGCGKSGLSPANAQQTLQIGGDSSAAISRTRRTAITDAVAKVAPSVVTVQTISVQSVSDPFALFFGGSGRQQQVTPGLGSGFIVQPNGVIVTNAHVVSGADTVSVMLRDGTVYPAKVLGSDETNDVAVIKIDADHLPVVKLGNSSQLLLGEWAIAIGNPYGFLLGNSEPSVTAGVISGVGRNLVGESDGPSYYDMIQTDASINPGNSGGPLVDADGEVVGVNSSIYSPSGGSIGLGFAIPINRVARVVDDLLTHHQIRRPWIGVVLQTPSTNPRDVIARGAIVATVAPNSPASAAGIQPGDVIEQVGPQVIHNAFDWQGALLDLRVGSAATVTLKRGSHEQGVQVMVADLPDVAAAKVQVLRDLQLVTVSPDIKAEHNLAVNEGAMIFSVSDAVTAEIGIQKGDVIVSINNARITSADDAKKAFDRYANAVIVMGVVRGRQGFQVGPFRIR